MPTPNITVGLACAIAVILMWSGFIVFARAGVTSGLTAYDLVALRFIVAGTLTLTFARAWWPRHLPLRLQILLVICGPGAIYSGLMFLGLTQASAAYGGVFTNGSLPIFTTLAVFLIAGEVPKRAQLGAIAVIVAGGVMLAFEGMTSGGPNIALGIALFLSASAVISVYIIGIRRWHVTPRQALAVVNIPNTVIFLPIWYFLLPSGLAETETSVVLLQALFQGLGPGFLAVILFAMTAYHLGPTPTAGFSAVVPATAALLAIPVLSEVPGTLEWIGIGTVTFGLALLIRAR